MPHPESVSSLKLLTLWDLDKGQFNDRNVSKIPPGGASSTHNVVYVDGVIRPRPGCSLFANPYPVTARVHHLSLRRQLINTESNLIAVFLVGTTLRVFELVSGTWEARDGGIGILLAGSVDYPPVSVNFKGNWYLLPGNNDLLVLPGGSSSLVYVDTLQTNTVLQPPDTPRVMAVSPDRLHLANVEDPDTGDRVPWRLHWCDHLQPEVWSFGVGAGTADYLDLAEDNEAVTAVHTYSDIVTYFKARSMYAGRFVGGTKTFDVRFLVDGPGCISQSTLVRYRDGKFVFLGDDNVYMARPGEPPEAVGDPIRTRIRETVDLDLIGASKALIDRENDLYWLIMPRASDGAMKKLFALNLKSGAWFEGELQLTGEVTSVLDFRQGDWKTTQLIGTSDGGIYLFSFDAYTDGGNAFTANWVSGQFSVEQLTSTQYQQCTIQLYRVFSEVEGSINLSVLMADGLYEFVETVFGDMEVTEDSDHLLTERTETGEFFKLKFSFPSIENASHVQGLGIGLMYGAGDTHR